MAKKRVYLKATEVERELQKEREERGFIGTVEETTIESLVETAKQNSKFGDKLLVVIKPWQVHIPHWQRDLRIAKAMSIGTNYNKYKWEVPKILSTGNRLICIDGQHRIYGSYKGNISNVTVELITDLTEKEAIDLFLDQADDRNYMSQSDTYRAAIEAEKPEYLKLREICKENRVQIKNHAVVENPIGILTSISDGVNMAKSNPELLGKILNLIGRLQWNGSCIYSGKAYTAKVLRVLKKLYAYYHGNEELLEAILLSKCKGEKFFNDYLVEKWQDTLFDYLSNIVSANMSILANAMLEEKASAK